MNASLHPPYGIPEITRIGGNIHLVRDRSGLFNMRVTDADKDGPPRVNITATFHESTYGPPGGIEIAIYWKKDAESRISLLTVRVGDKETLYFGPTDEGYRNEYLDVDALGLWDIGDDLIDFIPDAINMLGLIHQDLSDSLAAVIREANEYAVARLNADAKKKTAKATAQTVSKGRA